MDYEMCLRIDDGRFNILFGRDEMLICGLALGARGMVGSTYNFCSPLYVKLIEAFKAGDLETARSLQRKANEMIQILFTSSSSFFPVAKTVMKMVGVNCGPMRLPFTNVGPEEYEELKDKLEKIGFFEYCSK